MNKEKIIQPVIKWSGSKSRVSKVLSLLFPHINGKFIEPFVGGGAMLSRRPVADAVAGDVIPELIELWKVIQSSPSVVAEEYQNRWSGLQNNGYEYYYAIRDNFNSSRNPHDLLFLSRTCVNGLIRFNKDGDFNNSLHHTRPGIAPQSMREVINYWSNAIQGVKFVCSDYRKTLEFAQPNDLIFLDPPYEGTKGRYKPDNFDLPPFWRALEQLNHIGAKWVLTMDGQAGEREYSSSIPSHLYVHKFPLPTGNSPFTKLMNSGIDAVVESVYLNYELPPKTLNQFHENIQKKTRGKGGANDNMENSGLQGTLPMEFPS